MLFVDKEIKAVNYPTAKDDWDFSYFIIKN